MQTLRRRAYLGSLTLTGPALGVVWAVQVRQAEPDVSVVFTYGPLVGVACVGDLRFRGRRGPGRRGSWRGSSVAG